MFRLSAKSQIFCSVLAALAALLAVRAARAFLSFPACERRLLRLEALIRGRRRRKAGTAASIPRAVRIAARRLPLRTTCLDRSRAARLLLAAAGVDARMRLGVRRREGGGIEAHAWIEHRGRSLAGGRNPYVTFEIGRSPES
jgi:hypothetical protein